MGDKKRSEIRGNRGKQGKRGKRMGETRGKSIQEKEGLRRMKVNIAEVVDSATSRRPNGRNKENRFQKV